MRTLQKAVLILVLSIVPSHASAHDCSSPGDCSEVVKNSSWLSAMLAALLALVVSREAKEKSPKICSELADFVVDRQNAMKRYIQFLNGDITWEQLESGKIVLGNAFQGVTAAGEAQPHISRDIVAEVEQFEFSEEYRQGFNLLWAMVADGVGSGGLDQTHATIAVNEIERNIHAIEIARREQRENGCAD